MLDTSPSIDVLRFSRFGTVVHGISTRHGGVSPEPFASLNMGLSTGDDRENVVANRGAFAESLGVACADVIVGRLTHGNAVSVMRAESRSHLPIYRVPAGSPPAETDAVFMSDAVVSDVPGLYFLLTYADCVPLLFFDPVRRAVGAAHAGWRGTALQIGPAVVRAMEAVFGSRPENIVAGIGPAIGPCCYSVGPEVLAAFREVDTLSLPAEEAGETHLDLPATNRRQLVKSGVPTESIEMHEICTGCNVADFYSHRAERGLTGRFAALIGLE